MLSFIFPSQFLYLSSFPLFLLLFLISPSLFVLTASHPSLSFSLTLWSLCTVTPSLFLVLLLYQRDQRRRSVRLQRSRLRLPTVGHRSGSTGIKSFKTFFSSSLTLCRNKLECFLPENPFQSSLTHMSEARGPML